MKMGFGAAFLLTGCAFAVSAAAAFVARRILDRVSASRSFC
jgi:hypothetical protein